MSYNRSALTVRVDVIYRIIPDIGIEVEPILISDGIGLQESSERRRVEAGLVVIESQFRELGLAGVLEPS